MPKQPETPSEFLRLSLKQQSDRTTKMYLAKCTNEQLYIKNKRGQSRPCTAYGAVRKTLEKFNSNLMILYSYLYSLDPELKHLMDLRGACVAAVQFNEQQRLSNDRAKQEGADVEQYESFENILKEWLK